ncbi:prepilin-type N-terminal cleavage/methylation domain-containing protein [Fictibacillus sp. 7GRE50]|uniref:type II secretion system protein n=1 Tax=Fictibacillus sp. 7GRE50 TaxID=2745878 RepID=UPI0018CE84FA|nr:prepilin-type N-terminal cleavage/methylation domain-containing protein [Fictibacillus sp. 7GRE50]MBH0164028.1 prepilin-type N-terminal cleavage/methylation domain-containing protein [Fictibacillus sp. 7GRE50]
MLNLLKKQLKNEKGLTLIELLVVIVILGIIAAIAVVSIGGLLDNSKKDAHIANAEQLINAARMAVVADNNNVNGATYTMDALVTAGHLESAPKDPSGGDYNGTASKVVVAKGTSNGNLTYSVTLAKTTTLFYINGKAKPVRDDVKVPPVAATN